MYHPRFRSLVSWLGLALTLGVALPAQQTATPYHFTNLAHTATYGTPVDTAAAAAVQFNAPSAVVIDAQGNLIVADYATVRLVAPDGRVTLLAGATGIRGNVDGQGVDARFNGISGIAIDRVGNIVVADFGNRTIRRITRQGVVTTIAGSAGIPGHADGIGSAAVFVSPTALVVDQAGNILVADSQGTDTGRSSVTYYTTIRKITPDGIVSTVIGTYAANIPSGSVPGAPGAVPPATPADLRLIYVYGLALDPTGNLYLLDNQTVIKITPGGLITHITIPDLNNTIPPAIAGLVAKANGDVFFTDNYDHIVCKITPDGVLTTIAGSSGNSGNVDGAGNTARFYNPAGLALDANGNLFVADTGNNSIRKITPDGTVSTVAGRPMASTALDQLQNNTGGLGRDASDNLYASTANTILRLSPDGTLTTLAGVAGQSGVADGTGAAARFLSIQSFTVDLNGDVYVIDQNAVRKITAQGVVTTLAGDVNNSGSNDGPGNAAHFYVPAELAVDASGNVYVTDRGNYIVRKITPAGVVTTLAGLANVEASSDGVGPTARFTGVLRAITCDRTTGELFVLDRVGLRTIAPDGTVTTQGGFDATSSRITLDASGNLIGTTYITPGPSGLPGQSLITQITPAGVSTLLAGRINYTPVGTGDILSFGPVAFGLNVAADGRIFVRYDTGIFVGTPNRAPVAGTAGTASTPSNQAVTFALAASDPDGDPLTYTITGAVSGTATVTGNLATFTPTSGATGTGSVSFTATDGYATSATGTVSITITPAVTMLVNISTRGQVGTGDNALIAGFVLTGPANTPKTVLVRAAGPALAAQGVGRPLSRPVITLVQGAIILGSNQGWGTAGNAADIATVGATVSAFPFPVGSNDSALLTQLLPGVYSAVVSGVGGDGIALAEVYDGEAANPAHHPVNVSTRGLVGTGDDVLIAGLIVSGTSPQKFLIRAVGPGLSVFNIAGRLADPQFHLYQGPTVTMHVTGLTNDSAMQAAVTQTGAFPLPDGSDDAAAIVTLAPGNYTVIASSRSGASGIALVEVYQMP